MAGQPSPADRLAALVSVPAPVTGHLVQWLTAGALLRLAVWLPVLVAGGSVIADPDLWGHVRFGQDILASWSIPRVDPYSFVSDRTWVNHEWLAEVSMALVARAFGPPGLALLRVGVLLGVLAIVSSVIRKRQAAVVVHDALLLAVLAGTYPRTLAVRPQLYSLLLFAAELWLIDGARRGHPRFLWWLIPIFALWANLHGGWLVGISVLGLWSVSEALRSGQTSRQRVACLLLPVVSTAATLVSPYGVGLWPFLWQTVGLSRPEINDWQPLFRVWQLAPFWLVSCLVAAVALSRAEGRRPGSSLLIVAVLGMGALAVSRLDAFFSLAVIMLLGPSLAWLGRSARLPTGPGATTPTRLAVAVALAVFIATIGVACTLAVANLRCIRMTDPWLPEAEAVGVMRANHLNGRLFTWFTYGEYGIWHLAPDLRVSMDGRRETVYSDQVIADHFKAYRDPSFAAAYVRTLNADYAWLDNGLPAIAGLLGAGWTTVYHGTRSTILSRHPQSGWQAPAATGPGRCFPGP